MCAGIIGDACGEVERRTAGEGSGHTARMYVSEESHRGIVPMNHSNKDRTSSAESEGGRPRIKENTFLSDTYTYPTQSGTGRVPRVGECAGRVRLDLPTINVEHVDKRCHSSVRVNGDVKRLVNEEIVSIALADDAEIVDQGLLCANPCIELILSHTRSLVPVPRDLPHATDPLRLKMNGCVDGAAGAHRKT